MKALELQLYGKTQQADLQTERIQNENFVKSDKLDIAKLELIERIHKLEIELKDKMQKDKNDLMRWYFAYWISLVVLIVTNYFLLKH